MDLLQRANTAGKLLFQGSQDYLSACPSRLARVFRGRGVSESPPRVRVWLTALASIQTIGWRQHPSGFCACLVTNLPPNRFSMDHKLIGVSTSWRYSAFRS